MLPIYYLIYHHRVLRSSFVPFCFRSSCYASFPILSVPFIVALTLDSMRAWCSGLLWCKHFFSGRSYVPNTLWGDLVSFWCLMPWCKWCMNSWSGIPCMLQVDPVLSEYYTSDTIFLVTVLTAVCVSVSDIIQVECHCVLYEMKGLHAVL